MDTPTLTPDPSATHALGAGAPDAGEGGTLLLVDDDANILHALVRLLRREPYKVLTASSGPAALEVLRTRPVDVVLSDQRMPGMTGVEFLRQAKQLRPETVRLVLSGYTDLATVTDAINEGAIYKFLTKPWDDQFLRASLRESFVRKALSDENRRLDLELQQANEQLARYNEDLKAALEEQRRRLQIGEQVLRIAKDGLDQVPVPVIGIDHAGRLAFVNRAARHVGTPESWQVGARARTALPPALYQVLAQGFTTVPELTLFGRRWLVDTRPLGRDDQRGALITLLPMEPGLPVLPLDALL